MSTSASSPPSPQAPDRPAPLEVAMAIFPGMTLLDLAGPQAVLGMHGRTRLVAETLDPVVTDSGVAITPTATFADVAGPLDVLFVPGGMSTAAAMQDEALLTFLVAQAPRARYVTSVCTGSLILGAAGLLNGYRAATHWAFYPVLAAFDIEGVHERVVVDRNRITGGGVTAGIDFGLTLLTVLRGETAARLTQLGLEYDPQPPFDSGHPRSAGRELTAMATAPIQGGIDALVMAASAVRAHAASAA